MNKPTQEELDAQINKALEETPEEVKEVKEEVKETPEEVKEEAPEVVEETPEEQSKEEPERVEEKSEPSPEVDYKKKFIESTREGQVLYSKNKKVAEVLEKANQIPEPTEDELKKEFTDWELMSDLEKRLAKDNLYNKKRFDVIGEASKEFKDIDAWNENVDKFIDNPENLIKYPELEGKVEEFRNFATKPTRRNVDFEDLVASFSWDLSKKAPKPNKGSQLETGNGGAKEKMKPKSDKISLAEATILMQTNYSKYKELLLAGKIDDSIE